MMITYATISHRWAGSEFPTSEYVQETIAFVHNCVRSALLNDAAHEVLTNATCACSANDEEFCAMESDIFLAVAVT